MRSNLSSFRVLHVNMENGVSKVLFFDDRVEYLGGSGLAAALYQRYGVDDACADDPRQPLIFAIGPLTGFFPLMSKVVCGFRSPYTGEWAESHAGGRLALALRFSGCDALMITGRAHSLSCVVVGAGRTELHDVHYMRGQDVFTTGKYMRRFAKGAQGHRSILRIGPAGENGVRYACINVDSFRHFGRLGAGAAMGYKNLKGIVIQGDSSMPLPQGKEYPKLFRTVYDEVSRSGIMQKYHDLGTAENLAVLNELKALPWRNLQHTSAPEIDGISGERFAEQLLLRQTACAGCPVGCIHIGLLRQQFASEHEYLYRQVSYDYEPIFAQGSMLGISQASDVLALLDETEKLGLDCMSSGVALAWLAEAVEKGMVTEKETIVPVGFGNVQGFMAALWHVTHESNELYRLLGQGTARAAERFGGADFACVLGQEMAGYATGEVFFVSQAMGFRHSHLDSGGYSYDQSANDKDANRAVAFLMDDEHKRIVLNCMVSCMFARKTYTVERLQEALASVGMREVADGLGKAGSHVQAQRWRLKVATGFDVDAVRIPDRFSEVATWKGPVDVSYMKELQACYGKAIAQMVSRGGE